MKPFSPAESERTLVSVIVPVFNTQPELIQRAVDSALNQIHSAVEIVLVDDGSAIETAAFLDGLEQRDRRVRVIHRKNGGVSVARNQGIDEAAGEYIVFLDSDDYLELGFVTSALELARKNGAEVVFGGIRVLHYSGETVWRAGGPSGRNVRIANPEMLTEACIRALRDSPLTSTRTPFLSVTNLAGALYTAGVVQAHRFAEGVSQGEDRLFNVGVLLNTPRSIFCSDVWNVYDQRNEERATRRVTEGTVMGVTHTVLEFAAVGTKVAARTGLTVESKNRIEQAVAEGMLKYLKVLSGVMALVGTRRDNKRVLHDILRQPEVGSALLRAAPAGWRDRLFIAAAQARRSGVLLALGRIWVWRGGLGIAVATAQHGPRP